MTTQPNLDWTATDKRAVDLIRVLAMDAVQKVGNGHPGTAMSLAPAAYLLFQRLMRHDPVDPNWPGRDRFVLSCGHSSLTLYIQLYLSGYGVTMDDLKALRTWGSITPGHPEHELTPGVETTTGPLGQGIGNAVGMAMAARRERGLFVPDAAAGTSPFDHSVICFVSDGDIEEGISHEVFSLARHQELGNLIVLLQRQLHLHRGQHHIDKSEDVAARYEAYGWHVQKVDWVGPRGGYHEHVDALYQAFQAAKDHTEAPSFIALKTIIGWPAPTRGAPARPTARPRRARGQGDQGNPALRSRNRSPGRGRRAEPRPPGGRRGKPVHAQWGGCVRRRCQGQPGGRGPVRPDGGTAADGSAEALPDPGRRQGHGHPQGLGRDPDRPGAKLPELWGGSAT